MDTSTNQLLNSCVNCGTNKHLRVVDARDKRYTMECGNCGRQCASRSDITILGNVWNAENLPDITNAPDYEAAFKALREITFDLAEEVIHENYRGSKRAKEKARLIRDQLLASGFTPLHRLSTFALGVIKTIEQLYKRRNIRNAREWEIKLLIDAHRALRLIPEETSLLVRYRDQFKHLVK